MAKKLIGFHRKLRVWRDQIFTDGMHAGAKSRILAGIALAPGVLPKRSAKVPPRYFESSARELWSFGWKMGYAFFDQNRASEPKGTMQKLRAWERELRKRGVLRINSSLVGCWRSTRGNSIKTLNFARDGSFTGTITANGVVTATAAGTWIIKNDCLVLDYRSNVQDGEKNAAYEDTSVIMKILSNTLVIATGMAVRQRYRRVSEKCNDL